MGKILKEIEVVESITFMRIDLYRKIVKMERASYCYTFVKSVMSCHVPILSWKAPILPWTTSSKSFNVNGI